MISKMPDSPAKEMENQRERMEKDREKLTSQLEDGLSTWDERLRDIELPLGTIPTEPEDGEEPTAAERISAMNKRMGKIRKLLGERQTDEKAELDGRIKELETERDKLIKAIDRESKKKAAEYPKTKEERIADLEKQHDGKAAKETSAFEKKARKAARRHHQGDGRQPRPAERPGRVPAWALRGLQEPRRQAAHRRGPEVPRPAGALRRLLPRGHGSRNSARPA